MNKKQQETGCFLHVEERKRLIDMDKMPKWLLVLILVVWGVTAIFMHNPFIVPVFLINGYVIWGPLSLLAVKLGIVKFSNDIIPEEEDEK
jgi:hypothetical protein